MGEGSTKQKLSVSAWSSARFCVKNARRKFKQSMFPSLFPTPQSLIIHHHILVCASLNSPSSLQLQTLPSHKQLHSCYGYHLDFLLQDPKFTTNVNMVDLYCQCVQRQCKEANSLQQNHGFNNTPDQLRGFFQFSSLIWNQTMTNIFYAITSDTGTNICTHFLPSKGILWTFYYLRAFCPRDYQSLSPGHAGVADEDWYWPRDVLCRG